jgi:dTDP-glucose pyrophosphorylase
MNDWGQYLIKSGYTTSDALRRLNEVTELTMFVVNDNGQLIGTLTDGDIRRGLLTGKSLNDPVDVFMKTSFRYVQAGSKDVDLVVKARNAVVNLLPVLDGQMRIKKVINFAFHKTYLPIDAVIMAGGRGMRLSPLTDHTPKPLLKVGDKPILEHVMDWLIRHGIDNFNITLHYLAEMIVERFGDGSSKGVRIEYIREPRQMGTIGSLSLVPSFSNDTLLLMNSDLLTNIDLEEFYTDFVEKKADMSVACIPYRVQVPYAVVELENDSIRGLNEKPTLLYHANAGIYLLKRECVGLIPPDSHFNATDLVLKLISMGRKVCHYSLLNYWLDIGRMDDFQKAQEDIHHLKL